MRTRSAVVAALLAASTVTAVAQASPRTDPLSPWPTKAYFPADLHAPFAVMQPEHVRITGAGGVVLDGAIQRPVVPAGVKVPVVIYSTPYLGTYVEPADDPGQRDAVEGSSTLVPSQLVEEGFAVLSVSVRGTGGSGGCFDFLGKDEQRDQLLLVEAMAKAPWSNGRVGMMGLSYDGTTPLEAAVHNPPALKTIIAGAPFSSAWLGLYGTPNGAAYTGISHLEAFYLAAGLVPPAAGTRAAGEALAHPVPPTSRLCPEVAQVLQEGLVMGAADERPASFFQDRDFSHDFPKVRTSVLFTQNWDDDEYFSDETAFRSLVKAPKSFWHAGGPHTAEDDHDPTYRKAAIAWLDYWLKGLGPKPEQLGTVRWQTVKQVAEGHISGSLGVDHVSHTWPPEQSHEEALYLAAGPDFATRPTPSTPRSFLSVPNAEGLATPTFGQGGYVYPKTYLCPDQAAPGSLVWISPPLDHAVTIAGNARALLRLSADQAGGIVSVDLLNVAPTPCPAVPNGTGPAFTDTITFGIADLRFLHENWSAQPFPTGKTVDVRVDLHATAYDVAKGRRIALVVRGSDPAMAATPFTPTITLSSEGWSQATQVVLPFVGQGLGGSAPTARFPARPFDPSS